MFLITSPCETSNVLKVIFFLKELVKVAFIIFPIFLMLMMTIDFAKNVMANEDEMKKNTNLAIKRLLFIILLFLVPSIVRITFNILEDNEIAVDYTKCLANANVDAIIRYEEEEVVLKEYARLREEELLAQTETPQDPESIRKITGGESSDDNNNKDKEDAPEAPNASAQAFVNALQKMSNTAKKDYKNGHKWHYSNSGTSGSFKTAVKNKNRKTNCAKYISWGLVEVGILKKGQSFYKTGSNGIKYSSDSAKNRMEKNLKYINGHGKKAKTLIKNGTLKAGDIVLWQNIQHTNAYAGGKKWYDGGRWSANKGKTGFHTFGPVTISTLNNNWKVWKILRVKKA